MAEIDPQQSKRYIVCENGNGQPHVVGASVYNSLEVALSAASSEWVGQSHARSGLVAPDRLEIAVVRKSDDAKSAVRNPKYRFYYDTHVTGTAGDGTERDPWPDIATAMAQLSARYTSGQLRPRPGDGILLERRAIFTATRHERRKVIWERIAKYSFLVMCLLLVAPVIGILTYLTIKAWPVLNWEFLTQNPREYMRAGGIWSPLVGTFFLVLLSLLAAAPVGILAGVYLNEYARDNWLTRLINLAVVNLAGVPSIVHALFGLGAFVLAARMGESLLAASLTLAVMTLPVIITSTREALAAVPMSFREACWNMGASRWQTIRTIVLPNSISGILTGVILQVARAAGETAPILFTGAAFYMDIGDYGLFSKVMALSMHLYTLMTQVNNTPEEIVYGTAVVLIGLVLAVNSASIALRVYLRTRKKW